MWTRRNQGEEESHPEEWREACWVRRELGELKEGSVWETLLRKNWWDVLTNWVLRREGEPRKDDTKPDRLEGWAWPWECSCSSLPTKAKLLSKVTVSADTLIDNV